MDEMKNVKLYENESEWHGCYVLSDGTYLECWEWINPVYGDDEEEPDGAVYYNIIESLDAYDTIDGGVNYYSKCDTFQHFMDWINDIHDLDIIQKIN